MRYKPQPREVSMKLHCFLIVWFIITFYCIPMINAEQSSAPHIVTFFFKPALVQFCDSTACHETLNHLVTIPGHINRTILNQKLLSPLISGIYVTYAGLITCSDFNGQVSFPIQQINDTFTLVVTDAIKPVLLFGNTVNHLEFVENNPAQIYRFTRTHGIDKQTPTLWNVRKIERPVNNRLPENAIVIVAHPSHIVIIEGTSHADEGPNIILPHIYVTDTMTLSTNALQFLKVVKFFAPVIKTFGYARERYADIIVN